jgi:hypothetical protein
MRAQCPNRRKRRNKFGDADFHELEPDGGVAEERQPIAERCLTLVRRNPGSRLPPSSEQPRAGVPPLREGALQSIALRRRIPHFDMPAASATCHAKF